MIDGCSLVGSSRSCYNGLHREQEMTGNYPVPVTDTLLKEITRRIVEQFDPEKVILFGSHSTGSSRTDSDVDLLVIMDTSAPPIQRAVQVKRACRPRFVSMDVLVKTPEEVETKLERGSFFLRQILEQGKVLYERQP
jgi:predicted nucleotidyltransferase